MTITFPRPQDDKAHAWGLKGARPETVSERLSPAYEAQLERLVRALEARGLNVTIDGAGSEDGEYVLASHDDGRSLFQHLEDPREAKILAAMDDAALAVWLDDRLRRAD